MNATVERRQYTSLMFRRLSYETIMIREFKDQFSLTHDISIKKDNRLTVPAQA